MTPYTSSFTTSTSPSQTSLIHTANDSSMIVQTIGTVHTPSFSVSDVFHVPKLSFNLLSVGQLCELGYRLVFDSSGVYVQDPRTGQTLGTGRRVGRLFELSSLHISIPGVSTAAASSPPFLALWHSRLGHASVSQVQVLASTGLLGSVSNKSFDCISCQLGNNQLCLLTVVSLLHMLLLI
jgi:hypothetical protein